MCDIISRLHSIRRSLDSKFACRAEENLFNRSLALSSFRRDHTDVQQAVGSALLVYEWSHVQSVTSKLGRAYDKVEKEQSKGVGFEFEYSNRHGRNPWRNLTDV